MVDYLVQNDPFDNKAITFPKLLGVYKKYFRNYTAEIIHEDKQNTLGMIKNSLNKNVHLQILHLTQSKFE